MNYDELLKCVRKRRFIKGKYRRSDTKHLVTVDGITYRTVAIKDLSIGDKVVFVNNHKRYTVFSGIEYSNPLAGSEYNPLVNSNGRLYHGVYGNVRSFTSTGKGATVDWSDGKFNSYADYTLAIIE